MMGPGAGPKVQTCIELVKEVKGWDLEKGAKAFLDAVKKSEVAAVEESKAATKARRAETKAGTALKRAQNAQKEADDRIVLAEKTERDGLERVREAEAGLDRTRTELANSVAAVRDREIRVAGREATADESVAVAVARERAAADAEAKWNKKISIFEQARQA